MGKDEFQLKVTEILDQAAGELADDEYEELLDDIGDEVINRQTGTDDVDDDDDFDDSVLEDEDD